jgi:hypothetical protein
MKILLFLLGLFGGTAASASWLLSEPEQAAAATDPGARLNTLKERLNVAVADGRRAGEATQNRLRNELDAYRLHPDRPGIS